MRARIYSITWRSLAVLVKLCWSTTGDQERGIACYCGPTERKRCLWRAGFYQPTHVCGADKGLIERACEACMGAELGGDFTLTSVRPVWSAPPRTTGNIYPGSDWHSAQLAGGTGCLCTSHLSPNQQVLIQVPLIFNINSTNYNSTVIFCIFIKLTFSSFTPNQPCCVHSAHRYTPLYGE